MPDLLALQAGSSPATNDTALIAGRDLKIEAMSETHKETHFTKTKQSGVFSSGGVHALRVQVLH